jgi:rhodanese-related sulfurtransferase
VFFRQHNSAQPLTILVPPRLGSLDAMSAPAGKAVTQASPQSVATQKFTVIDIRAPAEYFQAHWPNSIHIPFTTAPPPSHTSGGSAQNYNDIVVLNPSTISANDLQPIVRLANQHYSESNFDALLVVVGSTVNDQNRVRIYMLVIRCLIFPIV